MISGTMKYDEDEEGRPVKRDTTDALLLELEEEGLNPKEDIELPNPSYFPYNSGVWFTVSRICCYL